MSKKRFFMILLVILLITILTLLFSYNKREVQEVIENNYKNDDNLIKNYAKNDQIEYLSESTGQYLYYLLLVKDEKEFKQQVDSLKNNFIIKKSDGTYIKWTTSNQTTTNASVDDFRIIEVLKKGGKYFQEPEYLTLANELEKTLDSKQLTDGLIVDFYDWELQKKATTVHLSYINDQIIKENAMVDPADYQKLLAGSTNSQNPFFKEIYTVDKHSYLSADKNTVNMIDQFMIAIQYLKFMNQVPPEFDQWVKQEWDTNGKLFGGYVKSTLTPAVPYESSAVYALAYLYFKQANEEEYAEQLYAMILTQPSFEKKPDYSKIHFFDYIWIETANAIYKTTDKTQ